MPFLKTYQDQVALLVRVIPAVAKEKCFALKGGTSINLFVRDMPRLSVDIDLTYLPIKSRDESLAEISEATKRIAKAIEGSIANSRVFPRESRENAGAILKIDVFVYAIHVQIEVTPVLRGCVFHPEARRVSPKVENDFGFAEMQVVSWNDLYAGKIVAALDRQHPRDLFDLKSLLENEGVTDDLREAFIAYLLSHTRPMSEVLGPSRKNIEEEFNRGFAGMTEEPVALQALLDVRERIFAEMVGKMPDTHRNLLLSFEQGEVDWSLIDNPEMKDLPAIKWREKNLAKLATEKREHLSAELKRVLGM